MKFLKLTINDTPFVINVSYIMSMTPAITGTEITTMVPTELYYVDQEMAEILKGIELLVKNNETIINLT